MDITSTTYKTDLESIRDQHSDNLYEICEAFIEYFEQNIGNAQEAFRCLLTQVEIPSYSAGEMPQDFLTINEEKISRETKLRLHDMERTLIRELIFKDVTEDYFYNELWRRLSDTLLVSSNEQKAMFLRQLWLDPCIPYYQLGIGVQMDEEKYRGIAERLYPQRKKLAFVMNVNYPQRTQKVSILMKIANDLSSEDERIVFWSIVLGQLENQLQRLRRIQKE